MDALASAPTELPEVALETADHDRRQRLSPLDRDPAGEADRVEDLEERGGVRRRVDHADPQAGEALP